MTTRRARRVTFAALGLSTAGFIANSTWWTLTRGNEPRVAVVIFLVLILGGILAAQWLTPSLFRESRHQLIKAVALQPLWPFAVFLIGASANDALRTQLGIPTGGDLIWMPLIAGSGLGTLGAVMLTARAALRSSKTPPLLMTG